MAGKQARRGNHLALLRSCIFTCLVSLVTLSLAATPASAARNHSFANVIATQGTGAGQLELAAPVPVLGGSGSDEKGGSGLAVNDSTHNIYVADTNNHRIDEYEATGGFIRAFGYGVLNGKPELEVCTATCRPGISGSAPGQLETPLFIAIDNSPGGEGDVYVADSTDNTITKYTSEGQLMAGWNTNGQLSSPPTEAFIRLNGIAVSDTGNLWIAAKTSLGNELIKYEQTGAYTTVRFVAEAEPSGLTLNLAEELYVANGFPNVGKFTAAGTNVGELFPEGGSNFTGLAVDSADGDLYLDQESTIDVVEPAPCPIHIQAPYTYCEISESFGAPQFSGGAGLAVDPDGAVVYAANTAADEIDRFVEEPAAPPLVTDEFSADVTATSARLAGEVDPRSLSAEESAKLDRSAEAETEYWFEYVTAAQFDRAGFAGAARTATGTLAPSFDATGVSGAGAEPRAEHGLSLSLGRGKPGQQSWQNAR